MAYERVILVSLDTLRTDALGAAPVDLLRRKYRLRVGPETPALNRLADSGAFFARTVSAAPYTSASHASYFTGLWPLRHGLHEFYNGRLNAPTLFSAAKTAGYTTIFKTDFPVILGGYLGFRRDVDSYIIEDDEAFLAELERRPSALAFAHFGGAHLPYGFHNLAYGGSAYREKVAELQRETGIVEVAPVDQLVETYRSAEDLRYLLAYKTATEFLYRRRDYDRLMELYAEGVTFFMRHRFQPFLDRLLAIAARTRSLIVVFGDHGEEYDEESRGHYDSVNEGVLRVPMIFYGPGVVPMQTDEMVRSVDLAPTVYDLQGWPAPAPPDGRSLANAVLGRGPVDGAGLPAFAQSYVSDTGEFLEVQKRTIGREAEPVRLRHVLYKERAWRDRARVTRQFHAYEDRLIFSNLQPIEPAAASATLDGDGVFRPSDAPHYDLLALLTDYNRHRRRSDAVRPLASAEIRDHLRAMGYRL